MVFEGPAIEHSGHADFAVMPSRTRRGLGFGTAPVLRAAMTQATRHMQLRLQSAVSPASSEQWRPAIMRDGRRR